MYPKYLKSFIDFFLGLFALLILSPFFLIIGILIKLDSKGSIFFKQERLGLNGKVFLVYKFRTMFTVSDNKLYGNKLFENDSRITNLGSILRKTSLDELPQIINIIKGEMSFIGPRPPVTYYPKKFEDYNSFERKRFLVKPGISGLAQIRCREIHDWNINIPIDIEYVDSLSFWNDIKLFISSLKSFFNTNNVYSKN